MTSRDTETPAAPSAEATASLAYFLDVYQAHQRRRLVTLDLHALEIDLPEEKEVFDAMLRDAADVARQSPHGDTRNALRAVLGGVIDWYRHIPENVPVRRVTQSPPEDPMVRRAVRVIAMVHELHKAGYQRIRMLPYLSPSGGHWRCVVTFSDNVADDGYHITDESNDRWNARYTTGQDNHYFGWHGAENLSARQLAERLLVEFPEIAARGKGRDWAYAGWVTDVLGRAEQGRQEDLLYLIADWEMDPQILRDWQPPPPVRDPAG